jgi:hypothetical protein
LRGNALDNGLICSRSARCSRRSAWVGWGSLARWQALRQVAICSANSPLRRQDAPRSRSLRVAVSTTAANVSALLRTPTGPAGVVTRPVGSPA